MKNFLKFSKADGI